MMVMYDGDDDDYADAEEYDNDKDGVGGDGW